MDASREAPTLFTRALLAFALSLVLAGVYGALMFITGISRDTDTLRFSGPVMGVLVQGMFFAQVSAPLFLATSFGVYLPVAALLGRIWKPSRAAAIAAGVLLCVPALVVQIVGSWVIFDFDRPLSDVLSNMARSPRSIAFLMVTFAMGGAIVVSGLGSRAPRVATAA
jgi:hypothetical protein